MGLELQIGGSQGAGREEGTKQTCWEKRISLVREALETQEKRGAMCGSESQVLPPFQAAFQAGCRFGGTITFCFWR